MFERRLHVLVIVLGIVCAAIAVRAFSLQAVGRAGWTRKAEDAITETRDLPTVRGRILDIAGREIAVDTPCIDACVHFQAITSTPDLQWLRGVARARVKKRIDNYADLRLAERQKLLAAEVDAVKRDLDRMWRELAALSGTSEDDLDDLRRQIERRVEVQRRLVWYAKTRATTQAAEPAWYAKLLGGGPSEPEVASVRVSEERDVHIVLPNISYALRNELSRRIDRYPGLVLREGVLRTYPYGRVACQTIGYIGKVSGEDLVKDPRQHDKLGKYAATDDIGRDGLEKMLEEHLRGTRGRVFAGEESAAAGDDALPVAGPRDVQPVPGQDVRVTLDIELQKRVEQAFRKIVFTPAKTVPAVTQEMNGAAVVIDVASGEVRALASWPTFDLNTFADNYAKLKADEVNRPLDNRAVWLAPEPGSTVKPIVGIAGITAGVLRPEERIPCDGYLYLNGRRMQNGKCWTMQMHRTTHMGLASPPPSDALSFAEALERSCNVFFETLASRMGIALLSEWYRKFGLGQPTGIGLKEKSGLLPDSYDGPLSERQMVTAWAGIGEHSLHATPIQMANVAATIARNGVSLRPTLQTGDVRQPVDLHLDPAAVAEARLGMDRVVNGDAGTGTSVKMTDVHVAAKTGSAQTGAFKLFDHDDTGKMLRDRARPIRVRARPARQNGRAQPAGPVVPRDRPERGRPAGPRLDDRLRPGRPPEGRVLRPDRIRRQRRHRRHRGERDARGVQGVGVFGLSSLTKSRSGLAGGRHSVTPHSSIG